MDHHPREVAPLPVLASAEPDHFGQLLIKIEKRLIGLAESRTRHNT